MFASTSTEDEIGDVLTNVDWPYPLWGYTIQYKRKSKDFEDIHGFYLGRVGTAFGFFLKDYVDYTDRGYGQVKLVNGVYRLVKTYPDQSGYNPFSRIIKRPVSGSVSLSGVTTTGGAAVIDYTTGIVTNATSEGTAEFEFHVPVKFANKEMRPTYEPNTLGNEVVDWANIELREVRNYTIAS